MKHFFCLILLALAFPIILNAQSDSESTRQKGIRSASNNIYLNVFGPTIPGSLNYERIWTKNGFLNIGTKIGGFYIAFPKKHDITLASGTFECTFIFGKKSNLFEMGFGWAGYYGSYYSDSESKSKIYAVPTSTFSMHYRYQKPSGGLFFHVGFTGSSILAFLSNDPVETAIGNGVVYGFKFLTGEKPSFSLVSAGIGVSL